MENSGLARYLPGGIPPVQRQSSAVKNFAPQFALAGLLSGESAPSSVAAGRVTAGGGLLGGAGRNPGGSSSGMPQAAAPQGNDLASWLNQQATPGGLGWSSDGVGTGARVGAMLGSPLTALAGGVLGGLKMQPGSSDTNAQAAASETDRLAARYPAPVTPTYTPILGQVRYEAGANPSGYSGNVTYGTGVTGYRNSATGEVTTYNPATHNSAGQYIGSIDYSSFRADDPYRNSGYYGGDEGE